MTGVAKAFRFFLFRFLDRTSLGPKFSVFVIARYEGVPFLGATRPLG